MPQPFSEDGTYEDPLPDELLHRREVAAPTALLVQLLEDVEVAYDLGGQLLPTFILGGDLKAGAGGNEAPSIHVIMLSIRGG